MRSASSAGTVTERLLATGALPELPIAASEIGRARDHAMIRTHEIDLSEPVISAVERIAAERDRLAVAHGTWSVTYAELATAARRLAALLDEAGVRPGTVVGVGGRRGVEVIAAFLAIELVGALYVPADTTWPAGRVRDVLAQAQASFLVSVDERPSPAIADGAAEAGVTILNAADATACEPWSGQPVLDGLDQPRYVLFTSGSTGRPKGAVVEHQGMVNHLWAKIVDLGLTGDDTLAQTAPLGFDISIWQMLCPLLVGGRVLVVGDEVAHDPTAFAETVERHAVTVVELVPTMVRHLLDDVDRPLESLRWMLATGEELPTEVARRWTSAFPHTGLLNAYGPTECSDDVTHHVITAADLDLLRLPIGTPVINSQLYVLRQDDDGSWAACEQGETGELFVGGVCVGRGYLGDHDKTEAAFFRDPFGETPTGRLYKTGDAVRVLPQGTLQYLGRVDRQVKIAGVRMELGEIEAVLQRHPSVGAAAVVVHKL